MIRNGEVWAFSTRKGGVLKTSMTVNLAGVLASGGYKVLIVDMDSQGNTMVTFGKNPDKVKFSIFDVLTIENAPVTPAIVAVHENIDILVSNEKMEKFELVINSNPTKYPLPHTLLREALNGLRSDYDYILIDTPPTSELIQKNALMFADKLIIPFQPEDYSMRALVKVLDRFKQFKKENNPRLEILGIVATLVDMRTSLHCEIMEETRRYCRKNDIPLLNTIIPKSVRYPSDVSYYKLPTTLAKPNHKYAECYFELLEEVMQHAK